MGMAAGRGPHPRPLPGGEEAIHSTAQHSTAAQHNTIPHALRTLHRATVPSNAALLSACAPFPATPPPPPTHPSQIGDIWPGYLAPYLPESAWPDSLALLPAPPAPGTSAHAADIAGFQALAQWRNTPRGALAVRDAELHLPAAAQAFYCALGIPVSDAGTPHLHTLLRGTPVYGAQRAAARTEFMAVRARGDRPAGRRLRGRGSRPRIDRRTGPLIARTPIGAVPSVMGHRPSAPVAGALSQSAPGAISRPSALR